MEKNNNKRASVTVLEEAIALQTKKSNDYQNVNSRVRQADYYDHGIETILDVIKAKYLRIISVAESMKAGGKENFESLEDSAIDGINYMSFLVSYLRGDIDGQSHERDIFNRPITEDTPSSLIPKNFKRKDIIPEQDIIWKE